MIKKNLLIVTVCLVLILCLAVPVSAAPVDGKVQITMDGVTPEKIDKMSIDPQSWKLHRDMTWDDYVPNPVVNWLEELDRRSLRNPKAAGNQDPIRGGLILIDYLDRKFISGQQKGSDALGFYLFNQDGSGYPAWTEENLSINPVISILDFPELYPNGYNDLPQFWNDYLNDPQATHLHKGHTIDEYWRENTYGKWAVELMPYGVYTIPYFEFEVMGSDITSSFQTFRDIPPSFRYGTPLNASASTNGTGNARTSGFDAHAREVSRRGAAWTEGNPYGLSGPMPGMSSNMPVPYGDFDFFFLLHAGYDESGAWQEFGQLRFVTRQDIPYEFGPGPRMKAIEQFFNDYPEWIPVYADRYSSGWGNYNGPWHTGQYNAATHGDIIEGYKSTQFWAEALARYNDHLANNTPFEFKLSQEDWDWVDNYFAAIDYVGRPQTKNTRYVNFTAWEAAIGEWSHMNNANGGAGFGQTGAGVTLQYSTQGENDGMATFAHEFGHIALLPDNYGSPWSTFTSPLTENWELMSRGSFAGPFGDHARWTIPGLEAGSVPVNMLQRMKTVGGYYDQGDLLRVNIRDLAASTPIVAEIVPRNIPLDSAIYPAFPSRDKFYKGIRLAFETSSTSPYRDLAARKINGFTWNANTGDGGSSRSIAMGVEVAQRTGYDSYLNDSGVLISRIGGENTGTGQVNRIAIINSHLYDIDMVDYYLNGEPKYYPLAHATQQAATTFKAGKSYTDTGYYCGGEVAGDQRISSDIVAGDSVNEWVDEFNKMHYYILKNNTNTGRYGEFLSYEVAVRHLEGLPVGGDLLLAEKSQSPLIPAKVGTYAQQTYTLTNTGAATDIVRVCLEGGLAEGRFREIDVKWDGLVRDFATGNLWWPTREEYIKRIIPTFNSEQNAVLLNDLYAIGPGETIEFDVYIKTVTGFADDFGLIVVASSETNTAKVASNELTVLVDAIPSAYVKQLSGNKNELYITILEKYNNAPDLVIEEIFLIDKNAAGEYQVGRHGVYVDTKGNTQIRACYLVGDDY